MYTGRIGLLHNLELSVLHFLKEGMKYLYKCILLMIQHTFKSLKTIKSSTACFTTGYHQGKTALFK